MSQNVVAPGRGGGVAARTFLMAIAVWSVALLHHGHIVMFLTDVRKELRGRKELEGGRIRQEPSKLEIDFGDPATHYIVAVHRKQRSLEVGLHFEGARGENERRLQALADHGDVLKSRLGGEIEMEHFGRGWTRVHDTTVLSRGDWSPKRDLTPDVVRDTTRKLLRLIRVLQPMLKRSTRERNRVRG